MVIPKVQNFQDNSHNMKNISLKHISLLILSLIISISSFSQILSWQFSLPVELTGKEESVKASVVDSGLIESRLTRGPNAISGPVNSRGFCGNLPMDATKADSRKSGSYYQFIVQAKEGHKVSLKKLIAILRRQEESAYIYRWMYSLDGRKFTELGTEDVTITDLSNNGVKQSPIDLSIYPELQDLDAKTTVTIRLYAWGGVSKSKSKRVFGFGKSNKSGSKVLWVDGVVTKAK